MAGGFELGLLLLLLCRGAGDALIHAGFGSRLGEVFVQLNLQAVDSHIRYTERLFTFERSRLGSRRCWQQHKQVALLSGL